MDIIHAMKMVRELNYEFLDKSDTGGMCDISLATDGDNWNVVFMGQAILTSEDYDVDREKSNFIREIKDKLRLVKKHLNTVFPTPNREKEE